MRLLCLIWIAFLTASAQWKCASGFLTTPFCRSNLDRSLILYSTRSSVRRKLLQFPTGVILVATSLSWPHIARSEEESSGLSSPTTLTKRPYAPVEALLPAVRVQMTIDRATQLALLLSKNEATLNKQDAIQELEFLLLQPQNYTRSLSLSPVPKQPSQQYLDTYQRNLDQMNLLQKPGALLVQSGEIDAWKRLKRQERLNFYTTNLSFDADSYLLNVPKSERSKMIREGRLPDVKSVIASDMGMRYLYRNNILTAVDEAKAEVRFQLKQPTFDASELAELLQTAQEACKLWFSLIDEKDVQEANDVLQKTKAET